MGCMIQLTKASQLTPELLKRLQALVSLCYQHDGYLTKFYWHAAENRSNDEFSEFIYWLDNQPVGYLALYQFSEEEIEVCAVVHPDFREQGIFSRLWVESTLEVIQRDINRAMFVLHSEAKAAKCCLESFGARYYRSELRMIRHQPVQEVSDSPISIRLATRKDIHLLAKMDQESFGGDYRMMYKRLREVMKEPDRYIFIAEIEGGTALGKVHMLCETEALVHDLCVRPAYQGQGYGKMILTQSINKVLTMGVASVVVEVSSDEYQIVKLYRSMGFEIACTYKYWMSQLGEQEEVYKPLLH